MPLSQFERMTLRDTSIPLAFAGEDLLIGGRSVKGIFTDGVEQVLVDGPSQDQTFVTSKALYVDVSENDFPTLPERGTVVIRDGLRYEVREAEPEGLGMIRLLLSESDLSLPVNPNFSQAVMLNLQSPVLISLQSSVGIFTANESVFLLIGRSFYRLERVSSTGEYRLSVVSDSFLSSSFDFAGGVVPLNGLVYLNGLGTPHTEVSKLYSFAVTDLGGSVTLRTEGSLPITGASDLVRVGTAEALWVIPRGGSQVYELRNLLVPPEATRYEVFSEAVGPMLLNCGTAVGGDVIVFEQNLALTVRSYLLRAQGELVLLGELLIGDERARVVSCTELNRVLYVAVVTETRSLCIMSVPLG